MTRPRFAGILLDDVTLVMVAVRGKIGEWGMATDSEFYGEFPFEEGGVKIIYTGIRPNSHTENPRHYLGGDLWRMTFTVLRGIVEFDPESSIHLRWNEDYAIQVQGIAFEGSQEAFVHDMILAKLFYL